MGRKWSDPSKIANPGEPSKDLIRRFNSRWELSSSPPPEGLTKPCKLWTGARSDRGYGVLRAPLTKSNIAKAHRVAWWIEKGRPPAGVQLDHKCRNRLCVEVEHLEMLGRSEHSKKSSMDRWHEGQTSYTNGEDIM